MSTKIDVKRESKKSPVPIRLKTRDIRCNEICWFQNACLRYIFYIKIKQKLKKKEIVKPKHYL